MQMGNSLDFEKFLHTMKSPRWIQDWVGVIDRAKESSVAKYQSQDIWFSRRVVPCPSICLRCNVCDHSPNPPPIGQPGQWLAASKNDTVGSPCSFIFGGFWNRKFGWVKHRNFPQENRLRVPCPNQMLKSFVTYISYLKCDTHTQSVTISQRYVATVQKSVGNILKVNCFAYLLLW